jgi:hypothetical protein
MKNFVILTVSSVLAGLVVVGCGTNHVSTPTPTNPAPNSGQLTVAVGDAPSDRIIAFALTVNTMTLTGGSNPTVISTPTTIEFVRNAGTFQPLVTAQVSPGTYSGATITVSNPQVVAIDTTTLLPVQLTASLSSTTVNVTFNQPLMIGSTSGSSPVEADFDLDLANSVTISGSTATINPVFHVGTKLVQNQGNGFQDIRGVVTAVTPPKFTVASAQLVQNLTFSTDSTTTFEGISGLSQLTVGMMVEIDAQLLSDGTLMAKRVEVDEMSADGLEVEGFTTSTTSLTASPVTQFKMIEEFDTSPIAAVLQSLGIGESITVNVNSTTNFSVSDNAVINMSGLSVSFDANDIGKAQRVEADAMHVAALQPSELVLTADRVRLLQQSLSGTVSNLNGSVPGTFTLTMAGDSAFALLSGRTTVNVDVLSNSSEDMPVANGDSVRVRGLLFFTRNTQSYTLVASSVTHD